MRRGHDDGNARLTRRDVERARRQAATGRYAEALVVGYDRVETGLRRERVDFDAVADLVGARKVQVERSLRMNRFNI